MAVASAASNARSPGPVLATVTHVLGPTLMPRFLMPRFYRSVVHRVAAGGPVRYHAMPEGGLGRTDEIVDSLKPLLIAAESAGQRVRLVGHSLGGIVAWALAHEHPAAIELAELWCAPIRGTALATVSAPVAESRFIAPASRWLRRYDRPLAGTFVRSVYTTLDQLAVPAARACYVEGDLVENHLVTPFARPRLRVNEFHHRAGGDHVLLPRSAAVNHRLEDHDAARGRRMWR